MKLLRACLLLMVIPSMAHAWQFSKAISVSELHEPHRFQHLESSGNRAIAVSGSHVAVTWEDNRHGKPEIFVAFKAMQASQFTKAQLVSTSAPAYEPGVAALPNNQFLVAWEANDHVWARIVSPGHQRAAQQLSKQPGRQVTITETGKGAVWLAWAQKSAAHYQIVASHAIVHADSLQLSQVRPVEPEPAKADQLYPSLAVTELGVSVAWEDRRHGHTRLYTAFADKGKWFAAPRQLNQLRPPNSSIYGKGTGSMRVVLASDGRQRLLSSWLDKRDFAGGYDVYAALSNNAGQKFGANEKVQDLLGENQAQWHAVCAMDHQGHAVVAWDDQRDGSPDIWLSWRMSGGWSDDESPPGTNGDGNQSQPAMVFDAEGRLHLAYLDRRADYTRIRYIVAIPASSEFSAAR